MQKASADLHMVILYTSLEGRGPRILPLGHDGAPYPLFVPLDFQGRPSIQVGWLSDDEKDRQMMQPDCHNAMPSVVTHEQMKLSR
jgi:hypothetical protein